MARSHAVRADTRFVIRDNDGKYGHEFDATVKSYGTDVIHTPFRAVRANAVCERFLRSVRQECLDHILIFSERQLLRIVKAYVEYFNHARPHQGLHQCIPCGTEEDAPAASSSGKVIAFPVLNGLHNDYRLAA